MNTLSLLTKGILYNSKITNGFITYEFVTKVHRKHGSGGYYEDLKRDYNKIHDDLDCINVTLNWKDRPRKYNEKKIYAEYVKSQITADLMLNDDVTINVELD